MHSGFANPAQTWDKRFDTDDYIFGTQPNVWLARHADLIKPGGLALAVADGEGRNSVWLAQQGLKVDAFDISAVGVAKAKLLADQCGAHVNFHVCSCEEWQWQHEYYDLIAAIFIQFADPDTRRILFAQMLTALKPGGLLILQGYTPKQLEYKTGGPPLVSHLYTEALLHDAFADMEIIKLTCYDDVLHEGSQHAGQSALVGMVARKR